MDYLEPLEELSWVVITRGPQKGRLAKVKERTAEMYYLFLGSGREASLFSVHDARPATAAEVAEGAKTRRHADYGRVKNPTPRKPTEFMKTLRPIQEKKKPLDAPAIDKFMIAWAQLMKVQSQFVADMGTRLDQVMASNNELLERSRKAEERVGELEERVRELEAQLVTHPDAVEE